MHPACTARLHHRRHERGAGRVQHAPVAGIPQYLVVRGQQGLGQEDVHRGQHGFGLALECGGNRLHRDLRGHLSVRMPPHPVGQHEEAGLPGIAIAHPVLVDFAAAAAAHLEDREFHFCFAPAPMRVASPTFCTFFLVSDTRVSSCSRIFSPTDSLV